MGYATTVSNCLLISVVLITSIGRTPILSLPQRRPRNNLPLAILRCLPTLRSWKTYHQHCLSSSSQRPFRPADRNAGTHRHEEERDDAHTHDREGGGQDEANGGDNSGSGGHGDECMHWWK